MQAIYADESGIRRVDPDRPRQVRLHLRQTRERRNPHPLKGNLRLLLKILQVAIEERVLAASLGQPYLAYRARVRRWLGVTRQLPA